MGLNMKIELTKDAVVVHPEDAGDKAFVEHVLGAGKNGDRVAFERVDAPVGYAQGTDFRLVARKGAAL